MMKKSNKLLVLSCVLFITGLLIIRLLSPIPSSANTSMTTVHITLDNLKSEYVYIEDLSTHQIISKSNIHSKIYPASMTKMMTAIVALENINDLNKTIQIPEDIFDELYLQNASMSGFYPNESVKIIDVLYGILLPSGAESCMTIANYVSQSEEKFVKLMNEKAKQIGMKDTHFMNTTGLHDSNHYSTTYDIALLLKYASNNDEFMKIISTTKYKTSPTSMHPDGLIFKSTFLSELDTKKLNKGKIIGGKTGFTEEAGQCLASLVEINHKKYVVVTAKADGTYLTPSYHIEDTLKIYHRLEKNQIKVKNKRLLSPRS